ncbi:MAG: nuclear transport factor 2 family protein [Bacteroidetes bacterium]|nr:nuclear transport factor 2 family protein [Bacteroidota bacterium]
MLALGNYAQARKRRVNNEVLIRRQIEKFVTAFRTRDLNLMMSLYAPGLVAFDIVPPLQDAGTDNYRKVWAEIFKHFRGPIDIASHDLDIMADYNVAFSYQLIHVQATMTGGQKADFWERMTFGFRKLNGKWLITHEHVSVPVNLKTGKAVLDLKP